MCGLLYDHGQTVKHFYNKRQRWQFAQVTENHYINGLLLSHAAAVWLVAHVTPALVLAEHLYIYQQNNSASLWTSGSFSSMSGLYTQSSLDTAVLRALVAT